MSQVKGYLRLWKSVLTFVIPVLLLPLALDPDQKIKCAFVLSLMSAYWVLGLIPESVTALIPIALFPMLGIMSTSQSCAPYMKSAVMMMIAGLMLAFAIEDCNLHKRIALHLMLLIGTGVRKILLGLMLGTMFISFWISNTATTAMMLPVTEAIVKELGKQYDTQEENDDHTQQGLIENQNKKTSSTSGFHALKNMDKAKHTDIMDTPSKTARLSKQGRKHSSVEENIPTLSPQVQSLRIAFFLSVAYSANIGGTGTLTGTGPNLVLQGLMDEFYPKKNDLSFASWMMYGAPGAILITILIWLFVQLYYLRKLKVVKTQELHLKHYLEKKSKELGRITFHESAVALCFVTILVLWFFKDPRFIKGWESLFSNKVKLGDATPAFFILISMFAIPANFRQFQNYRPDKKKPIKYLLNWRSICRKMPWGVILLVGGGFSLAEGTMKSGLSNWFGEHLSGLNIKSPKLMMAFLTIFAAFLTEITSNSATAAVILPVINQAALKMNVHPLYFLFPVTIAVSFAFMLPVATPCNALVYEYVKMKTSKMIKPGFVVNWICIIMEILLINTLGDAIFDFAQFPDWAKEQAGLSNKLNVSVLVGKADNSTI